MANRVSARADGRMAMVVREPVGVIATIAPWNNPFGIMVTKVVPALLLIITVNGRGSRSWEVRG